MIPLTGLTTLPQDVGRSVDQCFPSLAFFAHAAVVRLQRRLWVGWHLMVLHQVG